MNDSTGLTVISGGDEVLDVAFNPMSSIGRWRACVYKVPISVEVRDLMARSSNVAGW